MVTRSGSSGPPRGGLPDGVMEIVSRSTVPALILELPSERIAAASPAAKDLLSPDGGEIVGLSPESFTQDTPTKALDLLAAGQVSGFETDRHFRLNDGSGGPARIWVRAIGEGLPPRHALVVIMAGGRPAGNIRSPFARSVHAIIIGTTNANLVMDRVSSDAGPLCGREPAELIGQPIFKIVQQDDLVGLMWALAQATSERKGVSLQVHINGAADGERLCEMFLAPLMPPPSVAFALVPAKRAEGSPSSDVEQLLWQMRRGIEAVCTSSDIANAQFPALSELSSREIEVVARLFAGQRVPAIAKALFVSQSTVRNHLSSVFRKLNVRSQQELIDLLVFRKDATSSDKNK